MLENMRPSQIVDAVSGGLPLLWPVGSMEMHGYHLPVNTDLLFTYEVARLFEKRMECVIAPPIYYTITGYQVSGPELGTLNVDEDAFRLYAASVLESLTLVGFTRIFILNHHQGLTGPNGLILQNAAREVVDRITMGKGGRGWWGREPYPLKEGVDYPLIRVVQVSGLPGVKALGDHAGVGETSFVLYARGELVDIEELMRHPRGEPWYCYKPEGSESEKATPELGRAYVESMVEALTRFIKETLEALPKNPSGS